MSQLICHMGDSNSVDLYTNCSRFFSSKPHTSGVKGVVKLNIIIHVHMKFLSLEQAILFVNKYIVNYYLKVIVRTWWESIKIFVMDIYTILNNW